MKVTQIYEILKDVVEEITGLPVSSAEGEEDVFIIKEDLSNIVDVGTRLFDNTQNWKDNYVKALINRIGRMVFVDRPYSGWAPNILRDSWEYGSIMAKVRVKTFEPKPNPSWQLQNGQTVNQFESKTVHAAPRPALPLTATLPAPHLGVTRPPAPAKPHPPTGLPPLRGGPGTLRGGG